MATLNRIAQHFAAAESATVLLPPEPARGVDHFAIVTFRRDCYEFTPGHVEDAPLNLRHEDVTFGRRYPLADLATALRDVRAFNHAAQRQALLDWSCLAWLDGGYERLEFELARCVTPFTYRTHEILTPSDFRPTGPLDAPPGPWSDGPLSTSPCRCHATADEAVLKAIKANRHLRPWKRNKQGHARLWTIVLAIEADPIHETSHLFCQGRLGTVGEMRHRRFHLVDASWPLAPEILAAVKGGGA